METAPINRLLCELKSDSVRSCLEELKVLREYAKATEFWKIEPHDQKERRAFVDRIKKVSPIYIYG